MTQSGETVGQHQVPSGPGATWRGGARSVAAWPGAELPVPRVYRPRIRDVDGDVLLLETPSRSASAADPLPEEFFLRELLDVDLSSPEAIAHFTSEFGLLLYSRARQVGVSGADQRFWSPHRDLEELRITLQRELRDLASDVDAGGPESAARSREALPVGALLRSVLAQLNGRYADDLIALHADDFRLLAVEYRDLVRIWLDIASGGEDHRAKWESPHLALPEDPAAFLNARLAGDLRRFTPQLVSVGGRARAEGLDRTWSLNSALAAQLYNDVACGREYRRCALDDCGRLFARARGRSEQGRHRSDAKYCSKSCADLAMKRRQRARQTAAR